MRERCVFTSSIPIICFTLVLTACNRHAPVLPIESGYQWMAWSPALRIAYIEGFISGHGLGTRELCLAEDDKSQSSYQEAANRNPSLTAPLPSSECLEERRTYAKYSALDPEPDLQRIYADPITAFYTRHPEFRGVPFPMLLQQLSDQHYSSVDELIRMAEHHQLPNMIPQPGP